MWPRCWAYANRLLLTEETDELGFELSSIWTQTPHIFLSAIPEEAYTLNICIPVGKVFKQ